MAGSIYVNDQIKKILKTNKAGDKQFGLREQHKNLTKNLGKSAADGWIRKHVEITRKFREIMENPNWLGSDTETTSTGDEAEVVEFSLVRPDLSIAYDSLWRPKTKITMGSRGVHGITDEDVAVAPRFADERDKIQAMLDKVDFVMFYNGGFDLRVLEQTAFSHDVEELDFGTVVDPMLDMCAWIGEWNERRSGYKYAKLEGGHRAAGDVQEMIKVINLAGSSNVEYALSLIE